MSVPTLQRPIYDLQEYERVNDQVGGLLGQDRKAEALPLLRRLLSSPLITGNGEVQGAIQAWIVECAKVAPKVPALSPPQRAPAPQPHSPPVEVRAAPQVVPAHQPAYAPAHQPAYPPPKQGQVQIRSLVPPSSATKAKSFFTNIFVQDRAIKVSNDTAYPLYVRMCHDPNGQKLLSMNVAGGINVQAGQFDPQFAVSHGWQTVVTQDFVLHPGTKNQEASIGANQVTYVTVAFKTADGRYALIWVSREVADQASATFLDKHIHTPVQVVSGDQWDLAGKYTSHA